MATRYLVLASLLASSYAFSNTGPLIAWTSHSLSPLPIAASPFSSIEPVLESISNDEQLCTNDVIVVVEQPGLHASDLRGLSPSSPLSLILADAVSSVQLPYLKRKSDTSLSDLVVSVSERCNLPIVTSDSEVKVWGYSRYIMHLELPANSEESSWKRASDLNRRSASLHDHLNSFPELSKHLVLLFGTPLAARQQDSYIPDDITDPVSSFLAPNSSLPVGGVLKRYQLLTPALITTLLVAFFVLIPVIFFGISALASIEAPTRMEPPKRFNAQEKKTQ